MRAEQGRAKGILFNYLQRWAIDRRGQDAWDAGLQAASERERELYDGMILAMGWYPVSAWNGMCGAFFGANWADPNVGMAEFCRDLGDMELNSLVRMVLKIGSPEFMLRRTGFLWSRYFDTGVFSGAQIAPGHWTLSLAGPADPATTAGRLTCANGPGPWLQRGLELGGVKGTVRHVRCRYDGHDRCELEAQWRR